MTSQLDTSGSVFEPAPFGGGQAWLWTDLPNDFVRGYIEALFAAPLAVSQTRDHTYTFADAKGFRHLAPETLETILKDCARFFSEGYGVAEDDAFDGAMLWRTRQAGEWADVAFPPQTLILSDDGKVRFQ